MEIQPLGGRVLIKPLEEKEEKTQGGIYIPESAQGDNKKGEVISIGEDKDGRQIPLEKGDKILYSGMSTEEIEMEGEKFIFVEFKDVLGKINEAENKQEE